MQGAGLGRGVAIARSIKSMNMFFIFNATLKKSNILYINYLITYLSMSNPRSNQPLISPINLQDLNDDPYDHEKIERMFKFPASKKQALVHKKAVKFGYNSRKMKDSSQVPICPCCENPVNTIPIPICYSTIPAPIVANETKFLLNSGTSMYFTFIKMCIIYLVLRFLICDGLNAWTSSMGHFCKQNPKECSADYNSYLSGYNKHSQTDTNYINLIDYLNLILTITSIIYFYYCRKYQYKINDILEHSNISQQQFSIFIQNIPIFIFTPQTTFSNLKFEYEQALKEKIATQIKKWIDKVKQYTDQNQIKNYIEKDYYKSIIKRNKYSENDPIVASITLCYDLEEMETLDQLRKDKMDAHLADEHVDIHNLQTNQLVKHIPNQIKIINDKSIELSKRFAADNSAAFNLSHFIGKAFITFHYQHYRQYFLTQFAKDKDFFKIQQQSIYIQKSSQPQDVYWTNLKVSNEERASTLKQSFFILMVLLIFSLAILVGIDELQVIFNRKMGEGDSPDIPTIDTDNISADNINATLGELKKYTNLNYLKQQAINYLFVVLLPAITNFINFAITFAITRLTELQRHKTKTQKISSFIIKNVLTRFLNTAIIYYILSILHEDIGPLTKQGFVIKIMGLLGVTAFIQFVTELLRPQVLYRYVKNIISKCLQSEPPNPQGADQKMKYFQIQLNRQLQDPQFAFVQQYTFYLVQIMVASFYAVMVPAGVGILAFIFIVQYWLDKYNLFRKFSIPLDFDFFLTRLVFKAFQCSLLVFAVGTMIFDQQIRVQNSARFKVINLINIGLASAYLYVAVFGPQYLQQKIFSQEDDLYHKPYLFYYKKKIFRRTYWSENPATSFLKQKNLNDDKSIVQAPSCDKFIKPQEYDKYLNLSEEDIIYQTYNKSDQKYFTNYNNDDYHSQDQEQKKPT